MRSLLARLALVGLVGVFAGCGSNGPSLPTGGPPNNSGGGGTNGSSSGAPAGSVASVLIDGGVYNFTANPLVNDFYSPWNFPSGTFLDAQCGLPAIPTSCSTIADAGPDTKTEGSAAPPPNPPGWQELTFDGNGLPQIIFQYGGTVPNLTFGNVAPGDTLLQTYGAIVLFANSVPAPPIIKPPAVSLELTGGAGAARFDVRVSCSAGTGTIPPTGSFQRLVCDLPAYGANSGSYTTKFTLAAGSTTTGTFSSTSNGPAIQNPIISGATGTFVPSAATLYLVLVFPAPTPTSLTGNLFGIDYVYAEQGSQ